MYIAEKTLKFTIILLVTVFVIIVVITMILSEVSLISCFEKILLGILEKFVDFIRSLFVVSHDASREIINNFELP